MWPKKNTPKPKIPFPSLPQHPALPLPHPGALHHSHLLSSPPLPTSLVRLFSAPLKDLAVVETPFFLASTDFFFFFLKKKKKLGPHHTGCEILVPQQGLNPCPLQWKCGVSTTGPLGKTLNCFFVGTQSPLEHLSLLFILLTQPARFLSLFSGMLQ